MEKTTVQVVYCKDCAWQKHLVLLKEMCCTSFRYGPVLPLDYCSRGIKVESPLDEANAAPATGEPDRNGTAQD